MPSIRRDVAIGSAGLAAAVAASRVIFRPRPGGDRRLIDWEQVRQRAHHRAGEHGEVLKDAQAVGLESDRHAAELAPLMAEACGTAPAGFPHFTIVDRRGFIDANLVIARRVIAPLEKAREKLPASHAGRLSRVLMSRYIGELMGVISRRVLGQYDPVLMLGSVSEAPSASLYLVEPNILSFERLKRVPGEPLRRYLILHELTHAWQFESHPWLRDHLIHLLNEMLETAIPGDAHHPHVLPPARALLGRMPTAFRTQIRTVAHLQAVMSLVEGYSNFVMNRVGRHHLEHFQRLERAFHQRQSQRSLLERLVFGVTGMNMKLRQYQLGEKFSTDVADMAGVDMLNRVWEGPARLPSMRELNEPAVWVRRIETTAR